MFGGIFNRFSKKRNLTKGEVLDTKPVSTGYRAPFNHSVYFHWEDRPPFSLMAAEYMRLDPKVTLALAVRDGLLLNAKVKVEAARDDVKVFVEKQWEKLWASGGTQILRTKDVGYSGHEVMFERQKDGPFTGKIVFSGLKDFHPRDVRPLIQKSKVVGLTLRRIRDRGDSSPIESAGWGKPIWAPKSLWLTYRTRHGNWFGQPLLEHAYAPWFEKWMRGGAIKLRQLRMVKDAWIGDRVLYPEQAMIDSNGNEISWKDIGREICELRQTGGVFGLPSKRDKEGNLAFEYIPPTNIEGATEIFSYTEELDDEILEGLQTPGEVLEAASSGSGFSGRSIPFVAFLAILQEEYAEYVRQINEQVMRTLVRMNFGSDPFFTMTPASLIERISELMGDGESSGSGGGKPGDFGGGQAPGQIDPNQRAGQFPAANQQPTSNGQNGQGQNGQQPSQSGPAGKKPQQFSEGGADRVSWLFGGDGQTDGYNACRISTAGLRTDIVQGELIYQFAEDIPIGAKWITIGGGADGSGKQHVGGSPALVDGDGTILKGPKWAADAGITSVGESPAESKKSREKATVGPKDDSDGLDAKSQAIGSVIEQIRKQPHSSNISDEQMANRLANEWFNNSRLRESFEDDRESFTEAVKTHLGEDESGEIGQKRAAKGGEYGPNGEWYPGGSFIATTDMPKKLKDKLNKAASRGVLIEPMKREVPEAGKLSIFNSIQNFFNVRTGELNDGAIQHFGADREKVAELKDKYESGERYVSVEDYPGFVAYGDLARIAKTGKPIDEDLAVKFAGFRGESLEQFKKELGLRQVTSELSKPTSDQDD